MQAKVSRLLLLLLTLSWSSWGLAQTGEYEFTTIAGLAGTSGNADGTNDEARFYFPGGIAVDSNGILYAADILNHTIRKLTPAGTNWVVTTIAGLAGNPGSSDGTNSGARFDHPNGVTVDQAGNDFVADHYNHTIRKLIPSGTNWIVSTIAGLALTHGSVDGTNSEARFWSPTGIAVDTNGHLYVADTLNFTVRQIVQSGANWVVTTIAGLALNYGPADGTNSDAQFDFPYGITADRSGRLYVADFGNNAIRQILASGRDWIVSTIAGSSNAIGSADGPGWLATFNEPNSVCVDEAGFVYASDQNNNIIRKLIGSGTNWNVSTIGGVPLQAGSSDGLGSDARFKQPWGIAAGTDGSLFVADYGNHTIRRGVFIPALRIRLSSQKVFLLWPWAAVGYVPEKSVSLAPDAVWSQLTNSPATNGLNFVLSDQLAVGPVFYRLRKQ